LSRCLPWGSNLGAPLTAIGRYRPQEHSIASSPEDTRLAICQFEFGVRTRIKVRDRQMKRLKYGFRTDFSHQTNSTGVTQTEDLKLPRKLPQKSLDPLDPRRSLATTVCRPTSPTSPFFLGFGSIAVPPRPLPIVPEHQELVGPLGLEPRTKGFTLPRRFRREWTISSPLEGCGTL